MPEEDPRTALSHIRTTLPPLRLDPETCCYCGGCVGLCPVDALTLEETALRIDPGRCDRCGLCVAFCPVAALDLREPGRAEGEPETGADSADVVVVGAGPAGSACARALAQAGLDVVLIEKRQEIGAPKRCAEGIGPGVLAAAGIEAHPRWTAGLIRKAVLHAPGGGQVPWEIRSGDGFGFIVERKVFDKFLVRDAVRAGARTLIKATVTGVVREGGLIRGVIVDQLGGRRTILSRLVVAADGVESKVARSAGLGTTNRPAHLMSCAQYEMAGLDALDEATIHLFYGSRSAPGGYAWVFPKGGGMANVGVGIKAARAKGGAARAYLDGFIAAHPDLFSGAQALEINCGGVPIHPLTAPLVAPGLMVIGDAAHMVNPITGGGIKLALLSGKMAAEVAAEGFRANELGPRTLGEYPVRWEREHGRRIRKLLKLERFSNNLTDGDLDRIADILRPEILEQLRQGRFGPFAALILRKIPHLSPLAVKYLRS
jgi:digeranylgeranylglycerophospholipid reductase